MLTQGQLTHHSTLTQGQLVDPSQYADMGQLVEPSQYADTRPVDPSQYADTRPVS